MPQFHGDTSHSDLPATEPIRLPNMVATIMHTLFNVGQLRLNTSVPQDLAKFVENVEPILELTI